MRQPSTCRRAFFFVVGAAFSWLAAAGVFAEHEASIVRAIDVQYTGPATLSTERILAQMRTKVGTPYNDAVVQEDIRTLYKTGAVQNVRIFGQPAGDGVKVIVAVQTRPIIREIVIDGAHRIKAKKIRKDIALKLNAPVNEQDLEKGRQKVIESYQIHGFTDVTVQYRVEPLDEKRGTARVVYTVTEGAKGSVARIEFEGNTHFSDKVLRKEMKTKAKTLVAFFDKSGRLDEAQFQQDLDSVREFYQNHGYIDVEITNVQKQRPKGGPLIITIAVNEGTQYHVGNITFSGYKMAAEDKLRAVIKMKPGSLYSPKQLHDDAKAMADAYGLGGFVDTVITPEGKPAGPGRIDLHYKIEEGAQSFLQRINIVGNTRTKDKVIRREISVTPGEVFNTVRVETSRKRLENLGYFAKVDTFPETTDVEGRKDLLVQVEEKRTGSLNFGAGFSTIDSITGFVELTQGNFDIMNWPGFTGAGQKFRARAQVGTQRKDFLISLTEPWFLDRRLSLGGSAFYSEATYLSSVYDQRQYGFSVELRKPLFAFTYATLGYGLQEIEIYNVSGGVSPEVREEVGGRLKSQVNTSIVFDRRDNPILTHTGQRISIAPYVAGGFLGGDEQIYGFDAEASQYFHFPGDLILLFNGEIATVDVWDQPESKTIFVDSVGNVFDSKPMTPNTIAQEIRGVPIYDRLYLGGSNNLRGFAFRDISPKDNGRNAIGGQSLVRWTTELTFPIVLKTRGAFFYDGGFVNKDAWDFSPETQTIERGTRAQLGDLTEVPPRQPKTGPRTSYFDLAQDVGFGLRLDLPIGPLRLDYGYPLETAGNPKRGHINFSVGYQF
jgi:outer membrane protein insertion porin family